MTRPEQELQMAFFEWAKWNKGKWPELRLMHHIPNGGKRSKAEAGIFKAMGVRRGVPDVFLPSGRGIYHGLYIEFKSPGEEPRKDQTEFLQSLREAGYFACVCDRLDDVIKITQRYKRDYRKKNSGCEIFCGRGETYRMNRDRIPPPQAVPLPLGKGGCRGEISVCLDEPKVNMLYLLIDKYGEKIADEYMIKDVGDCAV